MVVKIRWSRIWSETWYAGDEVGAAAAANVVRVVAVFAQHAGAPVRAVLRALGRCRSWGNASTWCYTRRLAQASACVDRAPAPRVCKVDKPRIPFPRLPGRTLKILGLPPNVSARVWSRCPHRRCSCLKTLGKESAVLQKNEIKWIVIWQFGEKKTN